MSFNYIKVKWYWAKVWNSLDRKSLEGFLQVLCPRARSLKVCPIFSRDNLIHPSWKQLHNIPCRFEDVDIMFSIFLTHLSDTSRTDEYFPKHIFPEKASLDSVLISTAPWNFRKCFGVLSFQRKFPFAIYGESLNYTRIFTWQ